METRFLQYGLAIVWVYGQLLLWAELFVPKLSCLSGLGFSMNGFYVILLLYMAINILLFIFTTKKPVVYFGESGLLYILLIIYSHTAITAKEAGTSTMEIPYGAWTAHISSNHGVLNTPVPCLATQINEKNVRITFISRENSTENMIIEKEIKRCFPGIVSTTAQSNSGNHSDTSDSGLQ